MQAIHNTSYLVIVLVSVCFLSCTNPNIPELNGTWLITEMHFQGQPTYPKTTTKGLTDILQGFEDYETLSFRIVDSTVVLPGFSSDKLTTDFAFKNNRLFIQPNPENPQLELANLIFGGTYAVEYSEADLTLELTSDETVISLIHKDKVLQENIDNLFE